MGDTTNRLFVKNALSNFINKIIDETDISRKEIARYLNINTSSLNNKFNRNSFSLYDIIVICHVTHKDLTFAIDSSKSYCLTNLLSKSEIERIHRLQDEKFREDMVESIKKMTRRERKLIYEILKLDNEMKNDKEE